MVTCEMGGPCHTAGPESWRVDSPEIYDPEVLKSVCGDNPEVIERLLRRFDQLLDSDLRELEAFIVRHSVVDVRHQVHRIVGAALAVGALEVANAGQRLGGSVRAKDWDRLLMDVRELHAAVDRLKCRISPRP